MKYEDAVKIEELAAAVFDARQLVEMHRARNVSGTHIEQKAAYIDWQLSEARFAEAVSRLRAAQAKIAVNGELSATGETKPSEKK